MLATLDPTDQTLTLSEIRQFLAARYEDRFNIPPSVFEQVVGSVYRNLGYDVRVTGKTGDGGIDVVLSGPSNSTIGVQVKRSRRAIKAEQIRSFAGALMLGGMTRGMFVTTSQYQSGAYKTADAFAEVDCSIQRIELIDSSRFYDALGISQRLAYERESIDSSSPFARAHLVDLRTDPGQSWNPLKRIGSHGEREADYDFW